MYVGRFSYQPGTTCLEISSNDRNHLGRHGDGSIVLIDFIMKPCDGEHLEDNARSRLTDQEAIQAVCEICACKNVQEIGGWDNERRDNAVKAVLNNSSVSIRQLSRLTGISKAIIERISRR